MGKVRGFDDGFVLSCDDLPAICLGIGLGCLALESRNAGDWNRERDGSAVGPGILRLLQDPEHIKIEARIVPIPRRIRLRRGLRVGEAHGIQFGTEGDRPQQGVSDRQRDALLSVRPICNFSFPINGSRLVGNAASKEQTREQREEAPHFCVLPSMVFVRQLCLMSTPPPRFPVRFGLQPL